MLRFDELVAGLDLGKLFPLSTTEPDRISKEFDKFKEHEDKSRKKLEGHNQGKSTSMKNLQVVGIHHYSSPNSGCESKSHMNHIVFHVDLTLPAFYMNHKDISNLGQDWYRYPHKVGVGLVTNRTWI